MKIIIFIFFLLCNQVVFCQKSIAGGADYPLKFSFQNLFRSKFEVSAQNSESCSKFRVLHQISTFTLNLSEKSKFQVKFEISSFPGNSGLDLKFRVFIRN